MTIKIQDLTKVTTIIESTSVVLTGEAMPRVFFTESGWELLPKPRWITKQTNQREGNFKDYNGSDDSVGFVNIVLYGPNRKADLQTLKDIKEPVYLDADDYDTNFTGNYVMYVVGVAKNEKAEVYDIKMWLESYNN